MAGGYGFRESHAASFALIPYASSWMNRWHLDVFCASLLNAQPMRLHRPPQIVRDAREHGVEARPVCAMPPGGRVPSNLSATPMR
jgi:error-prone DNA polymerase